MIAVTEEVKDADLLEDKVLMSTESASDTPQSTSLILDDELPKIQDTEQNTSETTEIKELFPNFHLSGAMGPEEDLLDFQDIIKSHEQEVLEDVQKTNPSIIAQMMAPSEEIPSSSDIEIVEENTPVITSEETPLSVTVDIPMEALIQETSIVPENSDTPEFTQEYIAEVKTELSEGRRAGFRFFVQKNTKILTGVGIVLSLSALTMFTGSFFSADMGRS